MRRPLFVNRWIESGLRKPAAASISFALFPLTALMLAASSPALG
jgi:hypothetical protein